ncbi:MAG: hypothetical protein J7502_19785, partial [Flavisolibacter sp.]|nr:hypothetical protein [Flavisolibacter sp.]
VLLLQDAGRIDKVDDENRRIKLLNTREEPAGLLKKRWCVKGLARNLFLRSLLFRLVCVVS